MRVLFVCMGNICRSPTAEGVFRELAARAGLEVEADSAGTGAWHAGEPPDARSAAAAARRGIRLAGAARQIVPDDFARFDHILVADRANLRDVLRIAPDADGAEKVRLLREHDPLAVAAGDLDVPDPYYGGARGFDDVLDLVERACAGLVEDLRRAGA